MNWKSKVKWMSENPMCTFIKVTLIGFFTGILALGGGCSRYDKDDTALKNLIEQNGRMQDEKISQVSDRISGLKEDFANLSSESRLVSSKVTDMETDRKKFGEGLTRQNERLEEKYASLLERFESLSRQVAENTSSLRQLERRGTSMALPEPTQDIAPNEPPTPDDSSEESLVGLQQKLNKNLAEIKELRQKNPACYLNPKSTSIINLDRKIATAKDKRYCTCNNVTFVRDRFYCTGCKRVTGIHNDDYDRIEACCRVSSQQSFYRWVDARKRVDETTLINQRIDELNTENESLEKQIRSKKNSRGRR